MPRKWKNDIRNDVICFSSPFRSCSWLLWRTPLLLAVAALFPCAADAETPPNFKRENLVAWCIVPFDAKKRSPEERASMVSQLGLKRVAYDWREEHVSHFEDEIAAYRKEGIEFFAFWSGHDAAYPLFEKHSIKPQIWSTLKTGKGLSNSEKITNAVADLVPLAQKTKDSGLALGLYNHGGWGGLPDNMVAVCKALREKGFDHVGLVYNFHHAHPRIDQFADDLKKMKPYLLCVNLNGMANPAKVDVSKNENRTKPIGSGDHEGEMIAILIEQKYQGAIGILGHVATRDVEEVLRENIEGLEKILSKIP